MIHEAAFIIVSFLVNVVSLGFCPEEIRKHHHKEAVDEQDLVEGVEKLDHLGFSFSLHAVESHFTMLSEKLSVGSCQVIRLYMNS